MGGGEGGSPRQELSILPLRRRAEAVLHISFGEKLLCMLNCSSPRPVVLVQSYQLGIVSHHPSV